MAWEGMKCGEGADEALAGWFRRRAFKVIRVELVTGMGAQFERDPDYRYLERLKAETDVTHYIGLIDRPGVAMFGDHLEHGAYPPLSARARLFRLCYVNLEELLWQVITTPSQDRPLAEQMAATCGLRVADGVPIVLETGRERQVFPLDSLSAFTLEFAKGVGPSAWSPGMVLDQLRDEAIVLRDLERVRKERARQMSN